MRDPRTIAGIAAVVLVVMFAVMAVTSGQPDVRAIVDTSPTPTATAVITESTPSPGTPQPAPSPTVPPTAPPGVDRAAATSAPASAPPPATPWPTPDPAIWRWEGAVLDETGAPLKGVCVIIGPRGCMPGSIRTDLNGRYYVDMPQNPTIDYDFYFELAGYELVWHRARPSGPTVFNVVLRRV